MAARCGRATMHTMQSGAVDTADTDSMQGNCGNTDTQAFSLHTAVKRAAQKCFLKAIATSVYDL